MQEDSMFSKQHYEAIADAIRKAKETNGAESAVPWHAGELFTYLMRELTEMFREDNPRFNVPKFSSRVYMGSCECRDDQDNWEDEHVEPVPAL
jgi:hypothetical protein